jgi:hypothetical protein
MEAGLKVKTGQEGPSLLTHRVGRGRPARLLLLSVSERPLSPSLIGDGDSLGFGAIGDGAGAMPTSIDDALALQQTPLRLPTVSPRCASPLFPSPLFDIARVSCSKNLARGQLIQ